MNDLIQAIAQHPATDAFVFLYAFTAAVSTMPAPDDPRPFKAKLYGWMYSFLHLIMNKVEEKHPATIPNPQSKETKQ
jgi:hypothetical protein